MATSPTTTVASTSLVPDKATDSRTTVRRRPVGIGENRLATVAACGEHLDVTILDDLEARGLLHDTTDREALAARLESGPITLYYGCDPTTDSLHTGNLIGLLVLRRFQDAGHRVVALAGGATGMVGDPSGRSDERNLLDAATLAANVAAIKEQIAAVVPFDPDGERAVLVNNHDWTAGITLLDFLRDVGKHVTVNQMVARESVKARMQSEQGISFTEF